MNVQSPIELPRRLSIDAFFDWSEHRPERYELVNGTPRLQPWVKFNHNRIVMNLTRILHDQLDLERYELTNGDFAIKVGEDSIRYADLMVVPTGHPGATRFVSDACLIVEVLSDSTMHVDFGEKLEEYQALEDVQTYIVISQTPAKVWVWSRQVDGTWPHAPQVLSNLKDSIDIGEPKVTLPFSELYRNVT